MQAPVSHDRRWQLLGVIGIAQLMVVLDVTIVNIALPSAQRDLGFSADDRQWVITAYALAFGSLLLLGGRIGDLFGRKRVFITGLLGFAGASAVGGAASSFEVLVAARACQGVFGALLAPAALSLLTTTFTDPSERGKAFAIYAAIAGMGGAIGLLLGGALTELLDWRWCLYVSVVFALPAALAAHRGCCATCRSRTARGSTSAARSSPRRGLFALVFGLSRAETDGWGDPLTIGCLAASAILLIGLRRAAAPDRAAAAAAARRLRPRPRRFVPRHRHRQRGAVRPVPVPHVLPAADQGVQRVRDRAGVPPDEPLDRPDRRPRDHQDPGPDGPAPARPERDAARRARHAPAHAAGARQPLRVTRAAVADPDRHRLRPRRSPRRSRPPPTASPCATPASRRRWSTPPSRSAARSARRC